MAIYDDALHRWPVGYQTLLVPTGYGNTHVIGKWRPGVTAAGHDASRCSRQLCVVVDRSPTEHEAPRLCGGHDW